MTFLINVGSIIYIHIHTQRSKGEKVQIQKLKKLKFTNIRCEMIENKECTSKTMLKAKTAISDSFKHVVHPIQRICHPCVRNFYLDISLIVQYTRALLINYFLKVHTCLV